MSARPRWRSVPSGQPGAFAVAFPATYRGIELHATATAHDGKVILEPLAGVELVIDADVWRGVAPVLAAAEDLPPVSGRSGPPNAGRTGA